MNQSNPKLGKMSTTPGESKEFKQESLGSPKPQTVEIKPEKTQEMSHINQLSEPSQKIKNIYNGLIEKLSNIYKKNDEPCDLELFNKCLPELYEIINDNEKHPKLKNQECFNSEITIHFKKALDECKNELAFVRKTFLFAFVLMIGSINCEFHSCMLNSLFKAKDQTKNEYCSEFNELKEIRLKIDGGSASKEKLERIENYEKEIINILKNNKKKYYYKMNT